MLNLASEKELEVGSVLNDWAESLKIQAQGRKETFGTVKCVPEIGHSLFSVEKRTDNTTVKVKFRNRRSVIMREGKVIDRAVKGDEKWYRKTGTASLKADDYYNETEIDRGTNDSSRRSESYSNKNHDISNPLKDCNYRLDNFFASWIRHLVRLGRLIIQKRGLEASTELYTVCIMKITNRMYVIFIAHTVYLFFLSHNLLYDTKGCGKTYQI